MSDHILVIDESWRRGRKNFGQGPADPTAPEQTLPSWETSSARTFAGKSLSPAALDLHAQVVEYMGILKTIDEVRAGLQAKATLETIQRQLAPDQRVKVLVDRETGLAVAVQRPGEGYLFDPKKRQVFELLGGDGQQCADNRTPETTQFEVPGETGKTKRLTLDEGLWQRKGTDVDRAERTARERDSTDDFFRHRRRGQHEEP